MGFEIVRVQLTGSHSPTLQIMVERTDRAAMKVDDCAVLSRTASALLDVEDPVPGAYTLEVSSPGIDRPLVRPRDFERFAGFEAKIEIATPIDGQRRFRGRLIGVEGGNVKLALADGAKVALPMVDIHKAQLVLTDELLAAARAERRAAEEGRK
jgi:ribosome maturation factor RimP